MREARPHGDRADRANARAIGLGNIGAEVFRLAAPLGMPPRPRPLCRPRYRRRTRCRAGAMEQAVPRGRLSVRQRTPGRRRSGSSMRASLTRLMKPTAYLINTARGPIVNQKDLYRRAGCPADRGGRPRRVRGGAHARRRAAAQARQRDRHAACAVLDRRVLRRLAQSAFNGTLDVAHGRKPPYIVNPEAMG